MMTSVVEVMMMTMMMMMAMMMKAMMMALIMRNHVCMFTQGCKYGEIGQCQWTLYWCQN